jgi:hydrogenase-4 membrane subunit HyfE
MAGSRHLKRNILFYTLQTILLAFATAIRGSLQSEEQLYLIAIAIALLKAISIPLFLRWIVRKLCIYSDPGIMIAPPLVMHLSLILFACSYFEIASIGHSKGSSMAASASASLLLTGLLLMLTRRTALSQIIGFLVIENGIYLFAMTQTTGMPLIVEMGILLDVLAGVMIAGLVAFRIQKSFEHIDVTQLAELKDE